MDVVYIDCILNGTVEFLKIFEEHNTKHICVIRLCMRIVYSNITNLSYIQ